MNGATTDRTALRRLLAVSALLLGLFLMHGSPAGAAGCTGAPAVGAGGSTEHSPTSHTRGRSDRTTALRASAASADTTRGAALPSPGLLRAGDRSGGELCVSTPARARTPAGRPSLPGSAALVLPAGWLPSWRVLARSVLRRRGPPSPGRAVLIRVCVART
ncbi:hypothetical protein KNE206_51900 [Kitasatospora sp. NE20-6]|uniref:hypothetical protein n=1 Tax=Kitasatospora sp. NE20-6 TaxID=2859066 RepID=UPI0034DC3519